MAEDESDDERADQDENQYGGGDQDVDATEQTERMTDEGDDEDDDSE